MANVTEEFSQALFCGTSFYGTHQRKFFVALNIILAITAFLGNSLIIVSLQQVSFLHPPSKLLFRCLACTGLCVGAILNPIIAVFLTSPLNSDRCRYLPFLIDLIFIAFCAESLLILTGISVDRFLALSLGLRYRDVVTLRRVRIFVTIFWLSCASTSMIYLRFYGKPLFILYMIMLSLASSVRGFSLLIP